MSAIKNMSIGIKLLIFVFIAVILTITIIVNSALLQFSNFNYTATKDEAVKGMEGLHSLLEDYKEYSLKFATIISLNREIISAVEQKSHNNIYDLISSITSEAKLDFITILDNNGIVLASTHDLNKKGNSMTNLPVIQSVIMGNSFSTVEAGITGKLSVSSGAPIKDGNGKIIGSILTGIMLDKYEILDELKEIYKTDITLFWGDVRFNTTIVQNGNRLVGTKLDPEIADKVLNKKENYIGKAKILGIPYVCAYMPLIDSNNQAIGVLFSGQRISKIISVRNRIIAVVAGFAAFALVVFAFAVSYFIKRKVSIPLSNIVFAAEKIAEGNLDVSVDFDSNDEIGALCRSFNKMIQNLNEILKNITLCAKEVAAGSNQMSASSIALSQGATEQASSIQELTATLDEISTQTKRNAINANKANEIAEETKLKALNGNEQMKQMLDSMIEISKSSQDISKIIKVIDEIAFQTNILALNAAVEAARAGQHGKGFAVVAEEVRNLAMRSANAAKETTDMIESSIKKVEDGTQIANKTAEELNNIVDGISKVADFVKDIAIASNEQATGIAQVNQAIYQISQVVQTNSATSEENAAASEELSSQAEILRDQVDRFILKKNDASSCETLKKVDSHIFKTFGNMSEKKKIEISDKEYGKY